MPTRNDEHSAKRQSTKRPQHSPGEDRSRDPATVPPKHVQKVGIIGGGASGAIVLDSLVQEDAFAEVVMFERRAEFGGIWVYDDKLALGPTPEIKAGATRAHLDPAVETPFTRKETSPGPPTPTTSTNNYEKGEPFDTNISKPLPVLLDPINQERFEHTPAYRHMKTNIIEKMMTYSDEKQWVLRSQTPDNSNRLPYVERAHVQQYIARYIQRHVNHPKVRIETSTTVEDVQRVARKKAKKEKTSEANAGNAKEKSSDGLYAAPAYGFLVTLRRRLENGQDSWYQDTFDSLVVATGHYHVPYIPEVPGSRQVQDSAPGVFQHAKYFTSGEAYRNKTVVIVGSRALGTDLTASTLKHASAVYQLIRSLQNTNKLVHRENVIIKPVISRFDKTAAGFNVVFDDGLVIDTPHHVIYATGYQYLYPFLDRALGDITANGAIVPGLYQHTFLVQEPLLPIVGVPTDAISFRAFEFQAILVARFLSGKISLPLVAEQKSWLNLRYKTHGEARSYHTIGAQEARNYMKGLAQLGALENGEIPTGRHFPDITEAEVQEYVDAALQRVNIWDQDST